MKKIITSLSTILLIVTIVLFINNINNTKATPNTLVDEVIALNKGNAYTQGNGNGVYQTNNHEYRYVGGEVNNYVIFNNDLYRIIGVFDENSHGKTGKNLVKLIMANEYTSVAWGAYNSAPSYTTYATYKNDWTGNTTGVPASANIILNEFYLNPTSSTYGECTNWTYHGEGDLYNSKNCTTINGHKISNNEYRNYIENVTWYLYGYTNATLSKNNWYKCERNNYSGCTSANSGAYSGTATAKIGLMYVSDYLYASGYIASTDTTTAGSTNGKKFGNLNWLYNGTEWTINPKNDDDNTAFYIVSTGRLNNRVSYCGIGLRPTFYLKEDVYVTGGNGSFYDPYTIACDTCNS